MSVLLLRLAGPMQSWGTQSRFSVRDTGREPSKSGVIGLLCAALGRPRGASLGDLTNLTMTVRVDREGRLARDYHTAQNVIRADGSSCQDTVLSNRYYLADADFLVGLEGDRGLLEKIDAALRQPVWPLYLGRKSFVPGVPVALPERATAIQEGKRLSVLQSYPWQARNLRDKPKNPLRFVNEVPYGQGEPRQDVPLSFALRQFTIRHIENSFFELPTSLIHTAEPHHVSQPTDSESSSS